MLADGSAQARIVGDEDAAEFVQSVAEDLIDPAVVQLVADGARLALRLALLAIGVGQAVEIEIGRASCRERV